MQEERDKLKKELLSKKKQCLMIWEVLGLSYISKDVNTRRVTREVCSGRRRPRV